MQCSVVTEPLARGYGERAFDSIVKSRDAVPHARGRLPAELSRHLLYVFLPYTMTLGGDVAGVAGGNVAAVVASTIETHITPGTKPILCRPIVQLCTAWPSGIGWNWYVGARLRPWLALVETVVPVSDE